LRLQDLKAASGYVNSSSIVDSVRQIKTLDEQEKMRTASRLNDGVMEKLVEILSEDHTELELKDILLKLYTDAGCEGFSFEPITAYAGNAADPHHEPDGSRGKYGDCVVLDIGGKKDDYCSDMTRTVFLGAVTDRQREIYEIVREANLRGIAAAKPGNRMCDVDNAARSFIEEKGFGKYFTHRTGHSIGLEVHEAGDVSAVNEAIIQPGQCFSVEPGIYIPEENIGVRIEDLVLITEDGCEVLNRYPKEMQVIPFPENR
ncbi:MAG: aminopeptidase P family protein, partial [Clostridiales bacterium]|nr:aminopeptidase P family protein [Clostridiales bacterium]